MTEFETATLAVQQASLTLQQAGLELQQWQAWGAVAIPATALLVGAGQCALIWMGLRRMDQANRARLAEAETREKRDEARHAEAMKRDEARHAEAMKRDEARHAEAMKRLDQQADALRALVQGLERQGAALEAALKGGRA